MSKIGIVGSGMGSLGFAIRSAVAGHQVTVFEANSYPGGKLAQIETNGFRFDAGPSLFTMPHLVDELFTLAGKNPRDYFSYERLPEICRYFWEDGTRLQTNAAPAETAAAIASQLGESSENVARFLREIGENYHIISDLFLDNSLHSLSTWTGRQALKGYLNIPRLGLFNTMHRSHAKRFTNPKTVQLFDRYATYNGSDPYQTPATLSIIPHLEYNIGAFFPKGGIISIPRALHRLAEELGVVFHFNEKVSRITTENHTATGIETEKGNYTFDYIACNADIRPSYTKLLAQEPQPKKLLNQPKSSSGIIFYWGMDRNFDELGVHNIFFSDDYQGEFKTIFEDKTINNDPTIYLHISSKVEKGDAPAGGENWFILMNVPANEGQDWDALVEKMRKNVIAKLSRNVGVDIEKHIVAEDLLDPRSIEARTSSAGGALYGNASNNRFAAFLRHPNYRKDIKNLYWVGGSVHPGGGIPLCLSSAKIAAKLMSGK